MNTSSKYSKGIHLPCYGNQSCWGENKIGGNDCIFNPYGHGFHLDRIKFDDTLLDTAEHCKGVQVWRKTKVIAMNRCRDNRFYWEVTTRPADGNGSDRIVRCRILVNGSGRNGAIHSKLGVAKVSYDRLIAFVGLFETEENSTDSYHHTLIEACPEGWWYTSLLPSKQRVVVFHTDDDLDTAKHAKRQFVDMLMSTIHISALINKHKYKLVQDRVRCYPANSTLLSKIGRFSSCESISLCVCVYVIICL